MEYNKENYIGRAIWLFPNDTYSKKGVIKNVDDLGFTILITEAYILGKEDILDFSNIKRILEQNKSKMTNDEKAELIDLLFRKD